MKLLARIVAAVFLVALGSTPWLIQAQTAAVLMPVPKLQFLDANGIPLAGGKVYTYAAGTTTPQATYTDSSGTTPNTNPIILDSGGFANIWMGPNPYKIVVQDSNGVTQWTQDNVANLQGLLQRPNGSSIINFTLPNVVGASTRTLLNKLAGFPDQYDFGAVCDGSTDDYQAFVKISTYSGTVRIVKNTQTGAHACVIKTGWTPRAAGISGGLLNKPMAGEPHFFPWMIDRWLRSEARVNLTLEHRGLYRELLDRYYSAGTLPADSQKLMQIAGCTEKEFRRAWPIVKRWFTEEKGHVKHNYADAVRGEVVETQAAKTRRAHLGAAARWSDASGNAKSTSSSNSVSSAANSRCRRTIWSCCRGCNQRISTTKKAHMAAADKTLTLALAHDLAEILVPILREKMETAAPVQQVLFSIPEAARILGCSKRALESIIHEREIVVVRRGRRVYIHKRDLDAYIEKNRV